MRARLLAHDVRERRRREWSNVAIAGESKGEREHGRCRVVSSRLVSGEQAIRLADVLEMKAVDDVG